ncbi:hypothetical protein THER5_1948 [Bifidobacterium thermacidophilum subsp. thermacidophilum]|uniref:Uncharacterized protein n=1 Tax=Bifidobacterium thermacidophilum subsp. thermacidophilum TaxID=79262 RepID=A0A087E1Q5_9BIFI|nr:hypothetical protein THER5_1948 [Bifidobacterium thermacidophilum subsp. thermacidophilum]
MCGARGMLAPLHPSRPGSSRMSSCALEPYQTHGREGGQTSRGQGSTREHEAGQ